MHGKIYQVVNETDVDVVNKHLNDIQMLKVVLSEMDRAESGIN